MPSDNMYNLISKNPKDLTKGKEENRDHITNGHDQQRNPKETETK